MQEKFTAERITITSEIFKVLITCERQTKELKVCFDLFINAWGKLLHISCPPVCPHAWNNSTDFDKILY